MSAFDPDINKVYVDHSEPEVAEVEVEFDGVTVPQASEDMGVGVLEAIRRYSALAEDESFEKNFIKSEDIKFMVHNLKESGQMTDDLMLTPKQQKEIYGFESDRTMHVAEAQARAEYKKETEMIREQVGEVEGVVNTAAGFLSMFAVGAASPASLAAGVAIGSLFGGPIGGIIGAGIAGVGSKAYKASKMMNVIAKLAPAAKPVKKAADTIGLSKAAKNAAKWHKDRASIIHGQGVANVAEVVAVAEAQKSMDVETNIAVEAPIAYGAVAALTGLSDVAGALAKTIKRGKTTLKSDLPTTKLKEVQAAAEPTKKLDTTLDKTLDEIDSIELEADAQVTNIVNGFNDEGKAALRNGEIKVEDIVADELVAKKLKQGDIKTSVEEKIVKPIEKTAVEIKRVEEGVSGRKNVGKAEGTEEAIGALKKFDNVKSVRNALNNPRLVDAVTSNRKYIKPFIDELAKVGDDAKAQRKVAQAFARRVNDAARRPTQQIDIKKKKLQEKLDKASETMVETMDATLDKSVDFQEFLIRVKGVDNLKGEGWNELYNTFHPTFLEDTLTRLSAAMIQAGKYPALDEAFPFLKSVEAFRARLDQFKKENSHIDVTSKDAMSNEQMFSRLMRSTEEDFNNFNSKYSIGELEQPKRAIEEVDPPKSEAVVDEYINGIDGSNSWDNMVYAIEGVADNTIDAFKKCLKGGVDGQ